MTETRPVNFTLGMIKIRSVYVHVCPCFESAHSWLYKQGDKLLDADHKASSLTPDMWHRRRAYAAYKEPGPLANPSHSRERLNSPTLNDEEDVSQFRR